MGNADRNGRAEIVAILPRGEAIRTFVYSGTLDEVRTAARVSLLSVLPSPDVADLLRARADDLIELRDIPERWPVRFTREMLDLAHGRWLWTKASQERWMLRDAEANTPASRLKRLVKTSVARAFATRGGVRSLSRFERSVSRALRDSDEFTRLFERTRPSLVFNASHVHSRVAVQAVQAAQWLGIPTATFIFSWDNLTSQGRVLPEYDHYLVWNEEIRDQLLRIYDNLRPSQVTVTGTPQFDFHFRPELHWSREHFCGSVGADPGRPIVLYTTGMPNHMPGEPRFVEGIADMLRDSPDRYRLAQLLVRVYPKDTTGRFDELRARRPDILFQRVPWEPNWLTPLEEDAHVLTNTLRHCAVGINVASTITLELCMFDKPAINVGYNPPGVDIRPVDYPRYYFFDHYRPVVESGAIMLAGSEEQMRTMLARALNDPGEQREAREALVRRMFGNTLDGLSAHRCARRLIELATGQPAPATSMMPAPETGAVPTW
jgi:hypothetical protein